MTPPTEVFDDIEQNKEDFSIDDDDECVIEDVDSDEDSVEHRENLSKLYRDSETGDNIHDQLPSVEEVKASNAYMPTARLIAQGHRRKLYLTIAASALAAMILSVSISVGVFKRANKKASSSPAIKNEDRFQDVIQYIFAAGVSNLPDLMEEGSAEHNAAVFIANEDAFEAKIDDIDEDAKRRFMERYILSLIFYQTGGEGWNNRYNFLSSHDHCSWNRQYSTPQGRFLRGVQCNSKGFVVDLDLSNNNLVAAYIPVEVNKLVHLERLHFFGNTIGGYIDPGLKDLTKLKSLGLMNLDITGPIPDFLGHMTSLTTLALSQTKMSGTIPKSLSNLKNLRILGLDGIGLTGDIEPISKLSKLEALYLEDNHLSGYLDEATWPAMNELDASNNLFHCKLPAQIFNNPDLHVLDLNNNLIYGAFPQHTAVVDSPLEYLALQNNAIEGHLSDRIGYYDQLKHLDISGNYFVGTLPDTIQLLTNLVSIHTSGNQFQQQPLKAEYFKPLKQLQDISMKGNGFTGTLPEVFTTMTNLRMIDFDANLLVGTIPTRLGTLENLAILQLNRNNFSGTIPSELANLQYLQVLLLDSNHLKGKTKELCDGHKLAHFTADCYPSKHNENGPEVDCRCCTMCCADHDPHCNNHDWSSSYDPKAKYGYIRPAYEFSLDQAPVEWQKKAQEAAEVDGSGQ